MRVLFLHPDDDPESGAWTGERWDRIVDLGFAGEETYLRWSRTLACPIEVLPKLQIEEFSVVRQALAAGLDRLVDDRGLDWWELISIRFHEQIALIVRLGKLAAQFDHGDDISITRHGIHAVVLRLWFPSLRCFESQPSIAGRTRHLMSRARNLRASQIVQTLGDKYDAGYRVRRWASASLKKCRGPVVLLPSAHVTATKTALAYAGALPDRKFLLVATRQSGWRSQNPPNVDAARLAWYAPGRCNAAEYDRVLRKWRELGPLLERDAQISVLWKLGLFAGVPDILRDGLAVRDAWLSVFAREEVSAVFCTDDANPYTRIPLLLARERNLPTIACHHGALDGQNLVKRSQADTVLAKSRMERDYLVNVCGMSAEKIEIGAPQPPELRASVRGKRSILFFSEPYELDGGRGPEIYREVLPHLAEAAARMECELIVKLHPMEVDRERRKLVHAILDSREVKRTRIVSGPLTEELLLSARIAVTIQSTVAVECRLRAIPVFLCAWLDYSHFGYVDQFIKFGAGLPLSSPAEIRRIPEMLDRGAPATDGLWEPMSGEKLKELLSRKAAPVHCEVA